MCAMCLGLDSAVWHEKDDDPERAWDLGAKEGWWEAYIEVCMPVARSLDSPLAFVRPPPCLSHLLAETVVVGAVVLLSLVHVACWCWNAYDR